jgi:hypothetical protein
LQQGFKLCNSQKRWIGVFHDSKTLDIFSSRAKSCGQTPSGTRAHAAKILLHRQAAQANHRLTAGDSIRKFASTELPRKLGLERHGTLADPRGRRV